MKSSRRLFVVLLAIAFVCAFSVAFSVTEESRASDTAYAAAPDGATFVYDVVSTTTVTGSTTKTTYAVTGHTATDTYAFDSDTTDTDPTTRLSMTRSKRLWAT